MTVLNFKGFNFKIILNIFLYSMQTDWKIDMAIVDSMGDSLHNVVHSMVTDSVMGWNTVCYTRQHDLWTTGLL